jgi:hypothetical protein
VVVVHSDGLVVAVGLGWARVVLVAPGPVRVAAGSGSTGARSSGTDAGVRVAGAQEVGGAVLRDSPGRDPGEPALTLTPAPRPAHAPLVTSKNAKAISPPRRPDRIIDHPTPRTLGIPESDAGLDPPDAT